MRSSFTRLTCYTFLLAGLLLGLAAPAWAQAPAWQAVATAAPASTLSGAMVTASATDASGNVFVAGYFQGVVTIGSTTLVSAGQSDFFVAKWVPATQRFAWVQRASGTGTSYPTALAVSGGQLYVAGYFTGAMGLGSNGLTSVGNTDIFVAKLTETGVAAGFDWAYRAGGPGFDQANVLAVSGPAVYLAGTFSDVAFFGGLSYTSAGPSDVFLTRLTDAGINAAFTWTQALGGLTSDYASGVAVQGSSVYITGLFQGTVAFGNLSATSGNLPGLFVAKLNDGGGTPTYTWVQQAGGTSIVVPNALVVQGSQVYVAGRFQGTAAFGSLSVPSATTAGGAYDAFVAKLADAGSSASYVWALGAGGPLSDYVNALAVRGSAVYIGGGYGGTAAFGSTSLTSVSTSDDAFVARLTDAGPSASFAWAQSAGGISNDGTLTLATTSTAVYAGGWVTGLATFGSQTVGQTGAAQTGFLTSLPDATGLATAVPAAALAGAAIFPTPTPSGTLATVQLPAASAAGPATLTVLDAVGRVVRTRTALVAAGSPQATLDVAGLAPGVYALRVAVGESRGTARLVVE